MFFVFEHFAEHFNSKAGAQEVFGRAGACGSRGNFRGVTTCRSSLFSHGGSMASQRLGSVDIYAQLLEVLSLKEVSLKN